MYTITCQCNHLLLVSGPVLPPATAKASLMPITDVSSKTGTSDGKKSEKDKDKGKRLTKADIGTPSDFRCVFCCSYFPHASLLMLMTSSSRRTCHCVCCGLCVLLCGFCITLWRSPLVFRM